jgi:hypothetical protein
MDRSVFCSTEATLGRLATELWSCYGAASIRCLGRRRCQSRAARHRLIMAAAVFTRKKVR